VEGGGRPACGRLVFAALTVKAAGRKALPYREADPSRATGGTPVPPDGRAGEGR